MNNRLNNSKGEFYYVLCNIIVYFQSASVEDCHVPKETTGAPSVGKEERRGGDGAEDVSPTAGKQKDGHSSDSSPSLSAEREMSSGSDGSKGKAVVETVPKVKESSRSRKKEDKSIGEFNFF